MASGIDYALQNKALVLSALKRLGRKPWEDDFDDWYHDGLLRYAYHFDRLQPDVADAHALARFNRYATWLVYQDLLDRQQKQQVAQKQQTTDNALPAQAAPADDTDAPSAAMLAAIKARLSSTDQQVLALRYDRDLTNREIAAVLGLSTSRVWQIRQKIKRIYAELA